MAYEPEESDKQSDYAKYFDCSRARENAAKPRAKQNIAKSGN